MKGIDQIISLLNAQIASAFCLSAKTEQYHIAERVSKDGKEYPVIGGKKILPDSSLMFRTFWLMESDARYERTGSYGQKQRYALSAPMSLYIVGERKAMEGVCDTPRALLQELVDSLPRETFNVSVEVQNVTLGDFSFTAEVRNVVGDIYRGNDLEKNTLDLVAGRINIEIGAVICEGLCGSPLEICPSVTVTDTDQVTTIEVDCGDSFICTPCEPCPTISRTQQFSFVLGFSDFGEIPRVDYPFECDIDAVVLTGNITAIDVRKNGVLVTGDQSFVVGDSFDCRITRGISFIAGSASFIFDYQPTTEIQVAPGYEWSQWTIEQNCVILPNEYVETNQGLMGDAVGGAAFNRTATSIQKFTGDFTMEFSADELNMFVGISRGPVTLPAPQNYTEIDWSFYMIAGQAQIRELGTFITRLFASNNLDYLYRIRVSANVVYYEYSADIGASWIIIWPSVIPTDATEMYVYTTFQYDNAILKGAKLYL